MLVKSGQKKLTLKKSPNVENTAVGKYYLLVIEGVYILISGSSA